MNILNNVRMFCRDLLRARALRLLNPLNTKQTWKRWMFIFAGCFDLPSAPPSQTNLLNPWQEILYDWNARVARYVQEVGVLTWSQRNLQQYWHLCSYIAGLPDSGWVSRTLAWRPRNARKRGAPLRMWHSAAETFCCWKGKANWKTTAMNRQNWYKYTSDFCSVIFQS